MSLSGSLGAIPATAVFRRRFTSAIGENLLGYCVNVYANAAVSGQQMRADDGGSDNLSARHQKRF
jgi:hypothetical protein